MTQSDPQYLALMRQARELAQRFLNDWPPSDRQAGNPPDSDFDAAHGALLQLGVIVDKLRDKRLPTRPKAERAHVRDFNPSAVTPALENEVGVDLGTLAGWMTLDSIKGFGPQKAKELYRSLIQPSDVIRNPDLLPVRGVSGSRLRDAIADLTSEEIQLAHERAVVQLNRAAKNGARILTYESPDYPKLVFNSNNPVPILYTRGRIDVLHNVKTVACVGSRQIKDPYASAHHRFATLASQRGWAIVSGFALGADTVGHKAALEAGGTTICVMPGGLDRPFPPENRDLWEEFLRSGSAIMISEFAFGAGANSMNLRKRNKLIVAAARGVLVSQSSDTGGAMNAYRFAMEQRKPVATFASDNSRETSGNSAIVHESKIPTWSLPLFDGEGGWEKWLQRLSSSI